MPMLHTFREWLHILPPLYVGKKTRIINRGSTTVVFLHGLGNSSLSWDAIVEKVPKEYNIVTVDLLGFGKSPKPGWAKYTALQHAISLRRTLKKLHITHSDVIVVGHSLGAFVAIQYAKKYHGHVKHLVLCSPPFYQPDTSQAKGAALDEMYRKIYTNMQNNPEYILTAGKILKNYINLNKGIDIRPETLPAYVKSLEACIINQSSFEEVRRLSVPIDIIYGRLDVLLIRSNLIQVRDKHPDRVTLHAITAGHEVAGMYVTRLAKLLHKLLITYQEQDHPK
jgi:cis-3-alkyl-4-acyloxetan-2-one decarboxylase